MGESVIPRLLELRRKAIATLLVETPGVDELTWVLGEYLGGNQGAFANRVLEFIHACETLEGLPLPLSLVLRRAQA